MVKIKVLKRIGDVIDVGIHEIENIDFARQIVEKKLGILLEGNIPNIQKRAKEVKKSKKKKVY